MDSKTHLLKKVCVDVISFSASSLYAHRREKGYLPVVGEGNHDAKIMFIAEAPGINEARTGHHFVGKSGEVFEKLLSSIGLKRKNVYVTNIIKDKLPNNRDPKLVEIDEYSPFLIRQIKIIQPKVLVTLGRFSTNFMFDLCGLPIKPMGQIHGQEFKLKCSYGSFYLVPMYHPSAGLYNSSLISKMKRDFLNLKKFA